MNNLRQAAQRALKAMEDGEYRADMIEFSDALIALRAALAEPEQQPVSLNDGRLTQYPDGSIGVGTPAEPEQEPVAWMQEMPVSGNEERSVRMTTVKMVADEWDSPIPLYTASTPHPEQEKPVAFDHSIGAERFKVVRGAYWWHVLIGDSTRKYGKFHAQADAEEMAHLLLREFRNGAFVQHGTAPTPRRPLTDEEISELLTLHHGWLELARAVEAAHGITGEQK